MSKLQAALELAAIGYHVFPLIPGSKLPAIDGFPTKASRDPAAINRWWVDSVTGWEQDYNIGISTSRFGDDEALLVIDVDNKGDKHGDQTLFLREIGGDDIPPTATALTPTGGKHLFFRVDDAVRQGTDTLGQGLDVRSRGGYVVAAESAVPAGRYAWEGSTRTPVRAPQWAVIECGHRVPDRSGGRVDTGKTVDPTAAGARVADYLVSASAAVEGDGGDQATYRVCCKVKDFGVTEQAALDLLLEHWNPRCEPPWDAGELREKVRNAYQYGSSAPGSAAAENVFTPIASAPPTKAKHPFETLNDEFAFVLAGGGSHILWETKDDEGKAKLEHLAEAAFHKRHASWTMTVGKKQEPVTELWMKHKTRRSYDGFVFAPGQEVPPQFYNLWRGFAVERAAEKDVSPAARQAVADFLDHARSNVCHGDEALFRWLIGYFAHIMQRPHEKPLTSLVFRGSKGTGKNALIRCISELLGNHALLVSNRRYLIGQFNGHLESLLLLTLDEAFWSGDKQAEGVLKDLITGDKHAIEHKGKEIFTVANRTRVIILGNESWLAPASHDERRFAVFDVGDGRKQDRSFFQKMREGMVVGGYGLLLDYLLRYDIDGLDFNAAPKTAGLLEQKHESLDPLKQWWLDCMIEGSLLGSDFNGAWPSSVETERFRAAFRKYCKDRNVRSRMPDSRAVGHMLRECLPAAIKKRMRVDGPLIPHYILPSIDECRVAWSTFIGHEMKWE